MSGSQMKDLALWFICSGLCEFSHYESACSGSALGTNEMELLDMQLDSRVSEFADGDPAPGGLIS